MLNVGLTGGIGSGKSTVARLLADRGATVIDSDLLAREVVEPGTPGLAEIVAEFGQPMLTASGTLDRTRLARRVFDDTAARRRLEAIIHPRVRTRTAELTAQAAADAVIVNDVPLLAEVGLAPSFDLVVVVEAPVDIRLERLTDRGLDAEAAKARIDAQAPDGLRRAVGDVVIDNSGGIETTERAVAALWDERLIPFEDHKRHQRIARYGGKVVIGEYDPAWPTRFERLAARLNHLLGEDALRIDHIGSTAVPGLPAKDVIDLQVTVADLAVADAFADRLARGGFPLSPTVCYDYPKPFSPDRAAWEKRLHGGTDPANICHIHVRRENSPGWYVALTMRDYLREHPAERIAYADHKAALAAETDDAVDYAGRKEPWFGEIWPRVESWASANGRPYRR